jgi:hypothetical protein
MSARAMLQIQTLIHVGMIPGVSPFATSIDISWPLQNMHSARNNISTNFNSVRGCYREVAHAATLTPVCSHRRPHEGWEVCACCDRVCGK